jgi:plastocyanin
LAEAVVAISKRGLRAPKSDQKPATVTIDQKNFQFVPETVAIRTADQVRFLNSDDHVHNVRTNHPRKSFNINMPAGVEHVETFSAASGIHKPFKIECVFHSAMRAWVFVFDHPWFAVTGEDGAFELSDIPAGSYQLDVVHAAGDLHLSQPIEVVGGKQTEIEVRLQPSPVNSTPAIPATRP